MNSVPNVYLARVNAAAYAKALQCCLEINRYLRRHGRRPYEEVRRAMIGAVRCPGPFAAHHFTRALELMETDGTVTVETVDGQIYLVRKNVTRTK
jgi:hypothetical protein